jgi:hypothetical protein
MKKAKKQIDEATRASVKKEMAKPRMAESAREGERYLAAARIALGKLRRKKPASPLLPLLLRAR